MPPKATAKTGPQASGIAPMWEFSDEQQADEAGQQFEAVVQGRLALQRNRVNQAERLDAHHIGHADQAEPPDVMQVDPGDLRDEHRPPLVVCSGGGHPGGGSG